VDRVLTGVPVPPSEQLEAAPGERVALVDLLDRLLAGGVVIAGDITISIANVDLVRISLRAVIASIRPEIERCLQGHEGHDDHEESTPPPRDHPVEVPPRGRAW
jgi:gas vesicle protein GvpA/GvpJ/GvpM family